VQWFVSRQAHDTLGSTLHRFLKEQQANILIVAVVQDMIHNLTQEL
jgi:membrane-bound lytic murein transglycosylase MltF